MWNIKALLLLLSYSVILLVLFKAIVQWNPNLLAVGAFSHRVKRTGSFCLQIAEDLDSRGLYKFCGP